jgi:hypothetical protein
LLQRRCADDDEVPAPSNLFKSSMLLLVAAYDE